MSLSFAGTSYQTKTRSNRCPSAIYIVFAYHERFVVRTIMLWHCFACQQIAELKSSSYFCLILMWMHVVCCVESCSTLRSMKACLQPHVTLCWRCDRHLAFSGHCVGSLCAMHLNLLHIMSALNLTHAPSMAISSLACQFLCIQQVFLDALGEPLTSNRRSGNRGLYDWQVLNRGTPWEVDLILLDERYERVPLPCYTQRQMCTQSNSSLSANRQVRQHSGGCHTWPPLCTEQSCGHGPLNCNVH